MAVFQEIQRKFRSDQFEFSKHAADQSIIRGVSVAELRQAIKTGEIIEDYPTDKYGPSCLIFGVTLKERPLHINAATLAYPAEDHHTV